MSTREARRRAILDLLGVGRTVADEIVAADPLPYTFDPDAAPVTLPLADEPLAACWSQWAEDAERNGAYETLRRHLIQLRFPVREGMSSDEAYLAATRKGHFHAAEPFAPGLELRTPDALELKMVASICGRVPVVTVGDRADFIALVQALTARNEPEAVPDSMGACLVKGLNNWSRVELYKEAWMKRTGLSAASAWADEFKRLIPQRELYQDRLVLLSRSPYSATPASALELDEDDWLAQSVVIRREHELTHYFTYRLFGTMRSHVVDELIADFVGLIRGSGRYRSAWALRFLGLEGYPAYRSGGRLENYRGGLSDAAFAAVQDLAVRASRNLEMLSIERAVGPDDLHGLAALTLGLAGLSLEELASEHLPTLVG
jgi:hypothetical protein